MANDTGKTYVSIDWNKTKAHKDAQKAYEAAYAAMKAADTRRKALQTAFMVKSGLVPEGMEPKYSTRPWDGVVQVVKDASGTYEVVKPRGPKGEKAEPESI